MELSIKGTKFEVEEVRGFLKKTKGLMFRKNLEKGKGMLFFFEKEGKPGFWNLNVPFDIDILWIDREKKIIGIEESVKANSPIIRRPSSPCKYVLELKGGASRELGIRKGDSIDF